MVMRYRFMRFPDNKPKAVTFSYDDGVAQDIRLAEIFNNHGLKGTFNINTGFLGIDIGRTRMTVSDIQKYILDAGHEVAVHGEYHRAPGKQSAVIGIQDALNCRVGLEKLFNRIIRGMAYPDSGVTNFQNGMDYQTVKTYLEYLGIAYSRSLAADNNTFQMPQDWHNWIPTMHHNNPNSLAWAEELVNLPIHPNIGQQFPRLCYIWGHSYEFDNNDNWAHIEKLCGILSNRDDIWYATNIEIYDYTQAYNALICSADNSRVYNPTIYTIWFVQDDVSYCVAPGETLVISE